MKLPTYFSAGYHLGGKSQGSYFFFLTSDSMLLNGHKATTLCKKEGQEGFACPQIVWIALAHLPCLLIGQDYCMEKVEEGSAPLLVNGGSFLEGGERETCGTHGTLVWALCQTRPTRQATVPSSPWLILTGTRTLQGCGTD